jgi:hypothetical protein
VIFNVGNRKKSAGAKSVLQEAFISVSKHVLNDADSFLLLHVLNDADSFLLLPDNQQTRDKFCTDVVHLKFSS